MIFAIVAITLTTGCRKKIVDPVNDTIPCDTTYWTGNVVTELGDTVAATTHSRFDLVEFKNLNDINKMLQMVDKNRPAITANVVAHFPELTKPESIHFELWTGLVKNVLSGDGKTYSGQVQNELVFRIKEAPIDTLVFLACGNGMLASVEELEQGGLTRIDFGTATPWRFTILPGQGLADHLPALQEWGRVANDLCIPVMDKDGKIVSKKVYLNQLGEYKSYLFPYDVIDVVYGKVYNSKGQEAQFDTRLKNAAEKKKANKARAKRK